MVTASLVFTSRGEALLLVTFMLLRVRVMSPLALTTILSSVVEVTPSIMVTV